MATKRCKQCKTGEAVWAWQPDLAAFYALGWHQRGFAVVPVCEACREAIKTS